MLHTSEIEVDLDAVGHNMGVLRGIVGPDVALCPVLKADGYGLGARGAWRRLVESGAEMLAVYTLQQAAELADAAAEVPLLVLMPVRTRSLPETLHQSLANESIHFTIHDADQLEALNQAARRVGTILPMHVEVDTGMSRGGCPCDEAATILAAIARSEHARLAGLFTHFATADRDAAFAAEQNERFESLLTQCAGLIPDSCIIHAANSFATLRDRRFHRSMVRVGLAWTGYGAECMNRGSSITGSDDLRPSLTWSSRIVHVKTISEGSPVGYGSTWRARRESRIGLVPVGYADGYPANLGAGDIRGPGASVGIVNPSASNQRSLFAPVVGAVNMDQITIDLTELPGDAGVGTPVELISADPAAPNHLPRLAQLAQTIPYDLLCRLNPRIPRMYATASASTPARHSQAVLTA